MDITLETKIYDLLKSYPFMEDELIKINPKFKKLKNPILKRTVARVASIRQAAFVGNMEPVELLNKIRAKLGLPAVELDKDNLIKDSKIPDWIQEEPKAIIDANRLLDEEKNPLKEVNVLLKSFNIGDILLIKSDFLPAPLIDEIKKKGYIVFSKELHDNEYLTYIKKI